MSGRRVWQAKVLAEHPELRPAAEREQLAPDARTRRGGPPDNDHSDRRIMIDPNADPTPAELADWRKIDVANAKTWAAERLERARRLGDVEVRQHLGNLVAEIQMLVRELDEAQRQLTAASNGRRLLHSRINELSAVIDALRLDEHFQEGRLSGAVLAAMAALDS